MAPASTARQIGGKGRVHSTGNTVSLTVGEERLWLTKGPILAERIGERSEEWVGVGSPGVWCDGWVVCFGDSREYTVLVLITKLTMSPPGVPTWGDQFARAEFS